MLWFAAAAAALSAPAQPSVWSRPAVAQATATIRIISGVSLKLDAADNAGAPRARVGKVRTEDGVVRAARLIEFE